MIRKLFILLIILTTTTSAQSQTYEERLLLGNKFFYNQKNYEIDWKCCKSIINYDLLVNDW